MNHGKFPNTRLRRLRQDSWIRDLVQETRLSPQNLIWPLFVLDGKNLKEPIHSMPGVDRYSIDLAVEKAKEAFDAGIPLIALFP